MFIIYPVIIINEEYFTYYYGRLCQVLKKFCLNFSHFPNSYYSIMVGTHAIKT